MKLTPLAVPVLAVLVGVTVTPATPAEAAPTAPSAPTFRLSAMRVDCGATGGRSTTVQVSKVSAKGYDAATGSINVRFRVSGKPWRTTGGSGPKVTGYYGTLRTGTAYAKVRVRNAAGWGPWSTVTSRRIAVGSPSTYCGS